MINFKEVVGMLFANIVKKVFFLCGYLFVFGLVFNIYVFVFGYFLKDLSLGLFYVVLRYRVIYICFLVLNNI